MLFGALKHGFIKQGFLKQSLLKQGFLKWLQRRSPRQRDIRLDNRQIYILPSRNGLIFLTMALCIFVGGLNYSNSLILAVAFLLISLFLVSILHTYANLVGLRVQAGRAEKAIAGEKALFRLRLLAEPLNRKGRETFRSHFSLYLKWGDAAAQWVDVHQQSEVNVKILHPVSERGWFRPPRLRIESSYPLGLLRAWSLLDLDMETVVYPHPEACDLPRKISAEGEEDRHLRQGGNEDFYGFRDYQPGDSSRHIAWSHYARSEQLQTKQFASYASETQWLEWDTFAGEGVEERLSKLCYWVLTRGAEGATFGLSLPGQKIQPDAGGQHVEHCLTALALYGRDKGQSYAD